MCIKASIWFKILVFLIVLIWGIFVCHLISVAETKYPRLVLDMNENQEAMMYLYERVYEEGLGYEDFKLLKNICQAESGCQQFIDGELLRGRINSYDAGIFQINEKYHLKTAEELGLDIHTTKGNIDYAIYLYQSNGTIDWKASKRVWQALDF